MPKLPARVAWLLAAASGLWAGVLVMLAWPDRWLLAVVAAVWFGGSTRIAARHPWPGVLVTAVGLVGLGFAGLPSENAAPVGALMCVLAVTGYALSIRAGIWAVPLLLAATAVTAGWDVGSSIFGFCLLLLFWWFGVLVRGRDVRRREAAAEALRLARLDPALSAQEAAAAERERVAAGALAVISATVDDMTAAATQARAALDSATIDSIHRTGAETTQQLRALLVVLRERDHGQRDTEAVDRMDSTGPGDADTGRGAARNRRRTGWLSLLQSSWPAVLVLADIALTPWLMTVAAADGVPAKPTPAFLFFVALPVVAAVILRDRYPVAALMGTAAVIGTGTLTGLADLTRDGLWLAIAVAALSWAAGRAATRAAIGAWLVLALTVLTLIAIDSPDNLPVQIAMLVLPFGAAAAWSGHHTAGNVHLDQARLRQHEIATAERAAIVDERLHLARDLHDAASHAIGTMLMQVNAAQVLRVRDPDGARAALDTVVTIGTEAITELHTMATPLTTATTAPAVTVDADATLLGALAPLVASARGAGAQVTAAIDLSPTPDLPARDLQLLVRVVREGLANAVRHAPSSAIAVEVMTTPDWATARVTNGPPRTAPVIATGSGLGLRGLRELLDDRSGELVVGPTATGYELTAGFIPQSLAHPEAVP